ncbi:MAG TPA: DUF1416 domain-containing protein [Streptosporangiaceae bacterium]
MSAAGQDGPGGPAGCGAPAGGIKVTAGAGSQAVVTGRVTSTGTPVSSGYARLLNSGGEFVAEVPLGEDGGFTFYAAPGEWTLRVLAPGGIRIEQLVAASTGTITELELAV